MLSAWDLFLTLILDFIAKQYDADLELLLKINYNLILKKA